MEGTLCQNGQTTISDLPPQYQQMATGPNKRRLADELVNYMLMANEAKKRGLEDSPKFKRQIEMAKNQILAAFLICAAVSAQAQVAPTPTSETITNLLPGQEIVRVRLAPPLIGLPAAS